jgi:prepilin-type N-terminal cleavage/methylation domain-containing protein
MKRFLEKIKKQNGLTIIEMIVTISIIGVIAVVATGIIHVSTQTYVRIVERSIVMVEGRNVMQKIRSDLQKLAPDSILTMKKKRLEFVDIDGNAIDYNYTKKGLKRNKVIITKFLQNKPFQYYDKDMAKAKDPAELRFIRVTLSLQWKSETVQIEELVYVRNKTKI